MAEYVPAAGAWGPALLDPARETVGVVGRRERIPFGPALAVLQLGWWPLTALLALVAADAAVGAGLVHSEGPARSALGAGTLAQFDVLRPVAFFIGGLAALGVLGHLPRPRVAGTAGVIGAFATGAAAVSSSRWPLLGAALGVAVTSGALAATVVPMLMDRHGPGIRARIFGGLGAAVVGGVGLSLLISSVGGGIGLTWRSELLILAGLLAAPAAISMRLVDASPGAMDSAPIRRLVHRQLGVPETPDTVEDDPGGPVTVFSRFARVMSVETSKPLLLVAGVSGAFLWAGPAFLDTYLRDHWGMVDTARRLTMALIFLIGAAGPLCFGVRAEVSARLRPSALVRSMQAVGLVTVTAGLVAVWAPFGVTIVALALALAGIGGLLATAFFLLLTLVEPGLRPHAAIGFGAAGLVGAVLGQQVMETVGSRFGVDWAVCCLGLAPLVIVATLQRASGLVDSALDRLLVRTIELHDLTARRHRHEDVPLLTCQGLDFAYGQLQVLFGVSFTVDDGEMVALLGTNGAGKSTLLRLISGLGTPSAGSIHLRGTEITFTSTDDRVRLGISQIPGGRAVFGPLSVVDNLRAYGFSLGRHRPALDRAIEEAFSALPRLGERRNQSAATLSGGEQQMLGLSAAFILRPALLLIDELSLGLAPKIVADLLAMVRRINQQGTAVVLVEQSANIALALVDHAYFMEKGEMRFDGPARDLLGRADLLRSVFLEGATRAMEKAAG